MSSAAVVIGALRVKGLGLFNFLFYFLFEGGARLSQLQENNRQLNRACYNNQNNRGNNMNNEMANFHEDNTANQCLDLMEIANRLATVNNNMNNFNPPVMNMGFGLNQNLQQVNLQQIENMNRYGGPIRRPAWDTVPQINQVRIDY